MAFAVCRRIVFELADNSAFEPVQVYARVEWLHRLAVVGEGVEFKHFDVHGRHILDFKPELDQLFDLELVFVFG